ncbi:Ribonuclease [compost metagenome]
MKNYNTFFSPFFSHDDVVQLINEAYKNQIYHQGSTIIGEAKNGMQIKMYTDASGNISTDFPVYESDMRP